ncbi:hypothetical protein CHUAL_011242 [Chamberlinius hualienensis]
MESTNICCCVSDDKDTLTLLKFIDMITCDILTTMSQPSVSRLRNKRKVNHKKYLMKQVKKCKIANQSTMDHFWNQNQTSSCQKENSTSVWPLSDNYLNYENYCADISRSCCYQQVSNNQLQSSNYRVNSVTSPTTSSEESFGSSIESYEQPLYMWENPNVTTSSANTWQQQQQQPNENQYGIYSDCHLQNIPDNNNYQYVNESCDQNNQFRWCNNTDELIANQPILNNYQIPVNGFY